MFYRTHIFDNGIRLVHHRSSSPVGHCGLTVNAGSRDESEQEHGLAHLIEHAIFKGTKKRRAHHIINRMETVGGEINAFTTKEHTCIYSSFLKEDLKRSVELICDIVFHSTFPEKEISLEKEVIIDEINSYKDDPAELIFDEFEETVYKGNSIGRSILGTPECVRKFTREDLERFIRKNYSTNQMVFSIVIDMDFKRVVRIAANHLENIADSKNGKERLPFRTYIPANKRVSKNTHQAHCMIGNIAPDLKDRRRFTMALLNNITGGPGMNSRLNIALREKKGYAYNVESHYTPYTDTGIFGAYFGTYRENLEKCIAIVMKEFSRLRKKKLGTIQLSNAKRQLTGQLVMSFENKEHLMQTMGKNYLLFNRLYSSGQIFNIIENITSEDLMEMANDVFEPEKLTSLTYF